MTAILAFTIGFGTTASAQKGKADQNLVKKGDMVMGVVTDINENPLEEIKVLESSAEDRVMTFSTTTSSGDFSFKVVNPKDSLKIKHKGYQEVALPLDKKFFTITLKPVEHKEAKSDVAQAQ